MLFWSVFLKTHKKQLLTAKNGQNGVFAVNNFFLCVFKNTDQKDICVSIVFKAESKPKHKENFFWGGFSSKTKNALFRGPKWYFSKVKYQICISAFVLYCKRKLYANFHKKYYFLGPLEFFEYENLTPVRRCARPDILELDFLKQYLTFGYLTCSVR